MSSYRIAIIPGDGVGYEVALEATKILKAASDKHAFHIQLHFLLIQLNSKRVLIASLSVANGMNGR